MVNEFNGFKIEKCCEYFNNFYDLNNFYNLNMKFVDALQFLDEPC